MDPAALKPAANAAKASLDTLADAFDAQYNASEQPDATSAVALASLAAQLDAARATVDRIVDLCNKLAGPSAP